jgi:tetratricopeptide (TPR) repeat protein
MYVWKKITMGLLDFLFGKEFSIKQDYKLMNNWFSENLKHMQNKDYAHSIVLLSKMILKAKEMQSKLNENKPVQYTNENIQFDIVELYYMRATSKMASHNKDALDDFNTALAINPEHIESLYNRAVFYTNINKDITKALADISKCLKLQPNDKDFIQFQEGLINLEKELSETKESVKTTKKKTSSKVQKDSNNLKEVKGKLAEDAKKDSKEITDLLKKFHSIHIQRDANNIEEQIDLLDKIIPLIEKVQIPLYETYKKDSDPDPEHGYSACLITYADKELTFKYHYCELLYHRGTFKAMKGDVSAINDLEQSSEIVKEETTLINLALAYANLAQDIGKSINCISECVELFPNSTRAKEIQLKILETVNNSLDK